MSAAIFLAMGAVFVWLLLKGRSTGEIMARGWGTRVRIYRRDSDTVMYWITFWMYLILALLSTIVGIVIAFKAMANHVA